MKQSLNPEFKQTDVFGFTKAQIDAVKHQKDDILVSAGAGTGKTRVLVSRFIDLVVNGGIEVNNILCLTFTEKAADEMKERISNEFRKIGRTEDQRAVENAYVGTIHGFCARLLRENSFAAGIDPDFKVISEIDQIILMEEVLDEILDSGDEELIDLMGRHEEGNIRFALRSYIELNRCLGRSPERIDAILKKPKVLSDIVYEDVLSFLLDIQRQIVEMSKSLRNMSCKGKTEEHRRAIISLLGKVNDNTRDISAITSVLDYFQKLRISVAGDDIETQQIAEILKSIKEVARGKQNYNIQFLNIDSEALQMDINENLIPFLKVAERFWVRFDKKKRESGSLDYEDLQIITLDLLQKNPAVSDEYKSNFKHILIDEFQDINTLQKEILELLKPAKGFFIVGDIRQSIYGFRNAEVRIMREYRHAYNAGKGKCIELNENFRSSNNILCFINHFFTLLWNQENQPLEHSRKESGNPHNRADVELIYVQDTATADGHDDQDANALRELEANAVAARINELVEEGFSILDKATGQWRPVRYADIAVLVHTRSTYDPYAKAFSINGIPFVMYQSKELMVQREIQDVLAFLSIADNSRRDIDIAAVLRSPFCDISDDTLVAIRKCAEIEKIDSPYLLKALQKITGSESIDKADREKIKSFLALLDQLRMVKDIVPLGNLFDIMMARTDYEVRTLALWGGQRRISNLQKMREIIDMYGGNEGGLSDFIRFCGSVEEWGLMEEAEQETGEDDKVRFITIHGAKGLEFPVVILADLARQYNTSKDSIMVSGSLDAGFPDLDEENKIAPPRRELIKRAKRKAEQEEHQRQLYVAMTRARDCLILAGYNKNRNIESPLNTLKEHFINSIPEETLSGETIQFGDSKVLIHKIEAVQIPKLPTRQSFIESVKNDIEKGVDIQASKIKNRYDSIGEAVADTVKLVGQVENLHISEMPDHLAVTDLMMFDECPHKYYLLRVLNLPNSDFGKMRIEGAEEGLTGMEIGAIIHQILERVDYAADTMLEIQRLIKPFERSKKNKGRLSGLLQNYLDSEVAKEIKTSKRVIREVPFTHFISDIPIHGRADLIYQTGNGAMRLIDFKTNAIQPDEVESKAGEYRMQMEMYGLALSHLDKLSVNEGVVYFLSPNRIVKYDYLPENLKKCSVHASQIIEKIKKRDFARRDSAVCKNCEYFNMYCRHFTEAK